MDALGSIGSFFGSPAGKGLETLAGLGATGAGLYGNLKAEQQQQDQLNYLKNQEKTLGSPTKIAADVAAATQPLNRALVSSVENQVQGSLAEQGLAQAPGIQAATLSQALAPFQQQNQNTALQVVMERLGLPIQYASAFLGNRAQPVNLSPLMALLGMKFPGAGGGGSLNPLQFAQLLSSANMPGVQPTTSAIPTPAWLQPDPSPPDLGLPDWLSSAPPTAPAFG